MGPLWIDSFKIKLISKKSIIKFLEFSFTHIQIIPCHMMWLASTLKLTEYSANHSQYYSEREKNTSFLNTSAFRHKILKRIKCFTMRWGQSKTHTLLQKLTWCSVSNSCNGSYYSVRIDHILQWGKTSKLLFVCTYWHKNKEFKNTIKVQ